MTVLINGTCWLVLIPASTGATTTSQSLKVPKSQSPRPNARRSAALVPNAAR